MHTNDRRPESMLTSVESRPASLIDVAPTILSTLGVPVPQTMQGRNLTGAGANEPRRIFSETFPCQVMHPPECPNGGDALDLRRRELGKHLLAAFR